MNILVTGSEGLIGKPLCKMLQVRGDNLWHYDLEYRCDVMDITKIRRVMEQHGTEAVIHLAANSGVEQSRSKPYEAWQLNVTGTLNVLEACRKNKTPLIVASSNHIYGHGDEPVNESGEMLQLDTYSATKHAADVLARSYAHNYRIPVAVVRNTNCFGPDDTHSDHIIPGTILSLLKGEQPVIKSDGKTTKAYLYVDDVAEAYIAILDWVMANKEVTGQAFNVSGERVSVLDLVLQICALIDKTIEPVVLGETNDQSDEWLDDAKVRSMTEWTPKHTLAQGLEKTIEGFRARM